MLTLILMILGMLLMGIHAFWRPLAPPPYRPHFGWLGLAICVLAYLLNTGPALLR